MPPLLLLVLSIAVCAVAAWRLPVSSPMYDYLTDAQEWAHTGRIADTFTPLAYPLFGGLCLHMGGMHGLLAGQAALQTAIAMLSYALLRQMGLRPWVAFAGGAALLLHPDLLTSITKVWDVGLPAALLLALALLSGVLLARPPDAVSWILAFALGTCLGAAVSTRPNLLLLAPIVVWAAIFRSRKGRGWTAGAGLVLVTVLVAALTFSGLAKLEHGSFFLPGNGPYNLYAGNNPFSKRWLLQNFNAEPSLVEAWQADRGPNFGTNLYDPRLRPFYTEHALAFIRQHPREDAGLALLKLWTLLRPDTKLHPLGTAGGVMKLLLTLPAFAFALLLALPGRPSLEPIDWGLLLASGLYILPFMLTNADPHLRTPMDALWICGAIRLASRRLALTIRPEAAVG